MENRTHDSELKGAGANHYATEAPLKHLINIYFFSFVQYASSTTLIQ